MIVQWLFQGILKVVDWFASFLPQSPVLGLNDKAGGVVGGGFFARLGWVNSYIPLDEVALGISVVLGVFVVLWVIRLVIWILNKLHILGGDEGA